MFKRFNKIFLFLSLLLLVLGLHFNVKADSGTPNNSSFSISPLNPNTGQPQSTYYDLVVKPNEEKEIKVRVFNSSNQDIKVNVNANDAATNSNGVISYTGEEKQDASLKVPFSTIANLEQKQVTVPKNGSLDVPIHIKVPAQKFSGMILGGIRVTGVSSQSKESNAPAVKANIAYSVAVVLKEDSQTVAPSMHLLEVKKEVRNYRNYISANLQNSAPRLIKKLEANASVYKQGSTKLLYQAKKSEMEMAPNSNFNFGISLENHSIKPGKYTMKISGKADGTPYSFEKDFTVTAKEAKTNNENAVYASEEQSNTPLTFIVIGMGILLVLVLLGYFFILRKRKSDKEER